MEKQKKQKRAADLGNDPVGPLLVRLALPTVCAQVVNLLYNIVDRIYIGQIPVEGKLALTGICLLYTSTQHNVQFPEAQCAGHAA